MSTTTGAISSVSTIFGTNFSSIIINFANTTVLPTWSEWNPWQLCYMTRSRVVTDIIANTTTIQIGQVNVSCDLVCKY